jgi:hypothetical protein
MQHKSVIFVVIPLLAVALIYGSFTSFIVFAVPSSAPHRENCSIDKTKTLVQETCCWKVRVPDGTGNPKLGGIYEEYCQTCTVVNGVQECDEPELQFLVGRTPGLGVLPEEGVLEQPPTPPPSGPAAPLKGGILEQLEQGQGIPEIGFSEQQPPPADQGAAELSPPATEETQPTTEEVEQPAVPVCQDGLEFNDDLGFCVPEDCPEGQVLDEETGLCVLKEPEAPQEELEEQQQQSEEEQPSEGSGSEEEDTSNN